MLHLKLFRVKYRRGQWYVRNGNIELVFDYYPYLAFYDIEGYLRDGQIKIEKGMTVIDAGGCNGEFSLYAAKCVGSAGRVIMLEPDPKNVDIARRNMALNGNPSNLEIVPAGLWNTRGVLQFTAGQSAESTMVFDSTAGVSSSDVIEIKTLTLPDIVQDCRLERLDFIKMDIEGAEIEAIESAKALPARFAPRYSIASYHIRDAVPTWIRLEKMLTAMGYQCTTGYPRHLTTWAVPVKQ